MSCHTTDTTNLQVPPWAWDMAPQIRRMGQSMHAMRETQDLNPARLQATVVALAALGVYTPPFGKELPVDLINETVETLVATGLFPAESEEDCALLFLGGLMSYESKHPWTEEEQG